MLPTAILPNHWWLILEVVLLLLLPFFHLIFALKVVLDLYECLKEKHTDRGVGGKIDKEQKIRERD